jgi:hypothetical protein
MVLIEALSTELHRLLPEAVQEDRELYHQTLATLPQGLRAMAGSYSFAVGIAEETLISYFCNQDDERDLSETLYGLRELELPDIAGFLEETWKFFEPHLIALQTNGLDGQDFSSWLVEIGAEKRIGPLDKKMQQYLKMCGRMGLLESWAVYARKYPERCVAATA